MEGNYNSQTFEANSRLFEANSIYMVHPNLRLLQGVACITISCSTVWKQNLYMLSLPHFQISSFPKKKMGNSTKASTPKLHQQKLHQWRTTTNSQKLHTILIKIVWSKINSWYPTKALIPKLHLQSFNSKASPTKLQFQSFTNKSFINGVQRQFSNLRSKFKTVWNKFNLYGSSKPSPTTTCVLHHNLLLNSVEAKFVYVVSPTFSNF